MTVHVVERVPVLDQSLFPKLETDFQDKFYSVGGSRRIKRLLGRNAFGLILTALTQGGTWRPVQRNQLLWVKSRIPDSYLLGFDLQSELEILEERGEIQIVMFGNHTYIVPTSAFVEAMKGLNLNINSLQPKSPIDEELIPPDPQ